MLFDFSKLWKKSIIGIAFIFFFLTLEVYSYGQGICSFSMNAVHTVSGDSIDIGRTVEKPSAIIKDNLSTNRVNDAIRTNKKETLNSEEFAVRVQILSALVLFILLIVCLINCQQTRFFGFVRQRFSIILYIHNKDGRKGHSLSCTY